MNTASLRTTLKSKWLTYYRDNRQWIIRLRIWGTYEEKRRPSSSFILGALSAQEPELMQLLPLVVDLNNNPDRIVTALGLDFNPEDEMEAFEQASKAAPSAKQALKMPSPSPQPINLSKPLVAQSIDRPTSQPMPQAISQPLPQPSPQPNSQPIPQPVGSGRIPLDTAELSVHEQPSREADSPAILNSATPNDRSRDSDPLP